MFSITVLQHEVGSKFTRKEGMSWTTTLKRGQPIDHNIRVYAVI